jgi:hypothetical protein
MCQSRKVKFILTLSQAQLFEDEEEISPSPFYTFWKLISHSARLKEVNEI